MIDIWDTNENLEHLYRTKEAQLDDLRGNLHENQGRLSELKNQRQKLDDEVAKLRKEMERLDKELNTGNSFQLRKIVPARVYNTNFKLRNNGTDFEMLMEIERKLKNVPVIRTPKV
ncbi:uncharacterized protein LOC136027289 isoform X2 [Artemia franciscana]